VIKINGKYYDTYNVEIDWGSFETIIADKKSSGASPFITFNIKNKIFVGIETLISKEFLANMNFNEQKNINEYLTDILYKDRNGWMSILTGKYNLEITKINNNNFKIEFDVDLEEKERLNINVNTSIELI